VVGSAAIGYLSQQQTNKANANAAKNSGKVDMTTTRSPYGPASPYLDAGAQSAYDALYGTQNGPAVAGNPNGAPQGGARRPPPAGQRYNAKGQLVAVRNPAPGGGGGGVATGGGSGLPSTVAGKSGQSAATSGIIGQMEGLPGQNAGMNSTAEEYTTNLLKGQSSNPLLDPATAAAQNVGADPRLSAFEDYLMGGLGVPGGSKSGGGGYGGGGGATYYINPNTGQQVGGYGGGGYGASATGTDAALRALVAGKDPAGWADMQKAISDQVNASRAESLRNLKGAGVAGGFYGGSGFDSMEAQAVASGDQQLANQLAAARFGAYQNALQEGTQYDLGMADVAARDRATSAGSAASAGALAAQERAQNLGALGSALQLGEEGRYGTATNLGSLADLFSGDQKTALGGIDALAASRRGDLSAAGQLALGSDQTQNSRAAAAMAANASRYNTNAQIGWQKEQFYDPFTRLSDYTSILGGLYGGYGTEHQQGINQGAPAPYSSPWGSALQAGAIGGQLAGAYRQTPVTTGGAGSMTQYGGG
jgi:hypothetical protein